MKIAVVAALLMASAAHADRPSTIEWGALALAEVSLLGDAIQTRDIRNHPGQWETNPLLGQHPSDAKVVAYFAGAGLATAAAWYLLPRGWRFLVPAIVIGIEVPAIVRNAHYGMVMHF